jgi:hypothetical protein
MRKYVVLVLLLTMGLALPAQATPPEYVEGLIEATVSGDGPHAFESELPGCPFGTLEFVGEHGTSPGPTGVSHSVIDYEFDCDDGGFVIRLSNVQYSPPVIGTTGHWTVLASWGNMEGLHANGAIVGLDACSGGGFCIVDVYSGRYHFAP